MRRDIEGLKNSRFDLLVIGGGINGCAIARDAQLRGAKTALIEKDDFASGASGKTTKLIHGGIRYLEQFNFKLVYEALHERAILLKTAPLLVKPLEFLIPVYKDDPRPLLKIRAGIFLYDKLAGKYVIGHHHVFKKADFALLEPNLEQYNLRGSVTYFDAQVDDVRLCLENAISAYQAGCCVANKLEAEGLVKENGRLCGVYAHDKLNGEKFTIRASFVVNATGAWSNRLVKIDEPLAPEIVRPTKGIHLVYKRLPHTRAILLSTHQDKRIFFIIPWRNFSLIGTTDTDYSGLYDEVYATKEEVNYLLKETRRVFPGEDIDENGIVTTYAGLRPLVNSHVMPASRLSREHLIRESSSGLISVAGGKYTTYRYLAEQVVDLVLSKLKGGNFKGCVTRTIGPSQSAPRGNTALLSELAEYAVKEEMANSLSDLLIRRLDLFMTPSHGLEYIEEYAGLMAGLLGWDSRQKESEIRAYHDQIRKNAGRSL